MRSIGGIEVICDSEVETASTDSLELGLVELESLVARMRAMQVTLLRELDIRQVPIGDGCRSLSEWMVSRMDLTPETASRLSRLVASDCEPIAVAVAGGEISFDRAVELTAVDSQDPVADSEGLDIPRLRHHVASRRRLSRARERSRHADRYLALQPTLDQTGLRLWGELVGVDAEVFHQSISEAADRFPALPDGRREPRRARMADALVNLVIDSHTQTSEEGSPLPVVSVLVDAVEATATNAETGVMTLSGLRVGPDALDAVLCQGVVEVNALTSDGTLLGIGDRSRAIPPRVRRFVFSRDGGMCTADGCTSRYRCQPHHIRHRSQGGDHDPDNLRLLCWFHHHVVIHRRGFRIDPHSPPHRIRFLPPEPAPDPPH